MNAGCTSCGSTATVTVDGVHGRRCADCPPRFSATHYDALVTDQRDVGAYVRGALPAGAFRTDLAADMVNLGRADIAFAYLAAYLEREVRDRFDQAKRRRSEPMTVGRLTAGVITVDIVIGPRLVTS